MHNRRLKTLGGGTGRGAETLKKSVAAGGYAS